MRVSNFRAKCEQQLNAIWYPDAQRAKSISLLTLIIYYFLKSITWAILPISWLYIFIKSLYKPHAKSCNINNKLLIIIGNITVGGTGKTPIVAKLYQQLTHLGYVPGIISKGYLGKSISANPHFIQPGDSPVDWGDEPILLANRLADCPVVVCNNRVTAIQSLLTTHPKVNIILTDDGLQDKKLNAFVDGLAKHQVLKLAVIDSHRGLGNQRLLPAGPLRQPKSSLLKLDDLIIHQSKQSVNPAIYNLPGMDKAIWANSAIVAFEQLNHNYTRYKVGQFAKAFHKVRAVTGIGHPERFFQELASLGLTVEPVAYPDHFNFQITDLKWDDNLPMVITEKDAIKIQSFAHKIKVPIWVAKLDIMGLDNLTTKIQTMIYIDNKDAI